MKVPYDVVLPRLKVLGSTMAYREAGNPEAAVALFLHGNPTSSYIWRNIIPLVAPTAHCIAPDLIGLGQSGKPDIEYRFADHIRYLDAFLANAGISSAFVIAHDWGTALAFHLGGRRPEFIRGLAFMEFIWPMPSSFPTPESRRPTWRFPNELPIAGEPADVFSTLEKAHLALGGFFLPQAALHSKSRHPGIVDLR
jgi:haloalkane dehalogenase